MSAALVYFAVTMLVAVGAAVASVLDERGVRRESVRVLKAPRPGERLCPHWRRPCACPERNPPEPGYPDCFRDRWQVKHGSALPPGV